MNASIETRKEELKNEMNNQFESFKKDAENLMAACPEWKVADTECSAQRATIYLILASNEHRAIEIRFCKGCGQWQEEEFSTNIAAMGSFEVLDANGNANYYIAVGNLLSKTGMLSKLKAAMKDFVDKAYALRIEYEKLGKED